MSSKTEPFFRYITDQMTEAREEIKANINVTTADTALRKREEEKENAAKDPMARRDTISMMKRGGTGRDGNIISKSLFVYIS